ncbi:MAG: hypothetical protein ACOC16_01285 [Nanoarchaeota archaeon]
MVDINLGIEEIVEYSIIASLLLIIGGGIFMVSDTDNLKTKAISSQLSYIATLSTNYNTKIQLEYPYDIKLETQENNIVAQIKQASYSKNYFGKPVTIKEKTKNTYDITHQNGQ